MSESRKTVGRAPLRRLRGVQVLTTGSYVPETVVSNDELATTHGFDADWILQRSGIRSRRMLPAGMATSDMAIAAGRQCMERAELRPEEIDLLIIATFTGDVPVPSTSCLVQEALGLECPAMDLNAACAGFMYAMTTAMQFVANGCSQRALVIGAECLSRVVDPTDQGTFPLFGDAAGAAIIGPGTSDQGLLSYCLGADGSGANLIDVPMGGSRMPVSCHGIQDRQQFVKMDGRSVFRWAIRVLHDTALDVTRHAEVDLEDVDLLIAHQANSRILDAAADNLGFPREKMFMNLQQYGNTSAASIPLALDEACQQGRLKRDDLVLLAGFGAGLTWGTAVMKW